MDISVINFSEKKGIFVVSYRIYDRMHVLIVNPFALSQQMPWLANYFRLAQLKCDKVFELAVHVLVFLCSGCACEQNELF